MKNSYITVIKKNVFKSITRVQCLTIIAVVMYLFWEFSYLANWKSETKGPLIRVDLLLIYPLILTGIIISLWQLITKKNQKKH